MVIYNPTVFLMHVHLNYIKKSNMQNIWSKSKFIKFVNTGIDMRLLRFPQPLTALTPMLNPL